MKADAELELLEVLDRAQTILEDAAVPGQLELESARMLIILARREIARMMETARRRAAAMPARGSVVRRINPRPPGRN